jgi:DNA polymerase-1
MAEEKKLFLLDGYALVYRAYFAFINNPRVNSAGLNTSAMFGFTNLILDVIKKHKPTHLAVVFDPQEEASERNGIYEGYKAHRQEMPEDLQKSLPYIARIVDAFRIPLIIKEGYEADDVIGTLAKKAEEKGYKTYMMTSDKDYGQLVTENTFWYKPGRMGSPDEVLGIKEVCKKFDVDSPAQVIELLGLMGDAADNIPGIPGVGEKTAIKLLKEFGTVENLLKNTDSLKGKMKEKVEENADLALLSKQLATIITDVPVEFKEEELILEDPDKEKLKSLFAELEFRTLSEKILGESIAAGVKNKSAQMGLFDQGDQMEEEKEVEKFSTIENVKHQYFIVNDANWRKDLLNELLQQKEVCIDTETTSLDVMTAEIVGLSFCFKTHVAFYIPMPENESETRSILNEFQPFFENESIRKIGQNIKYDLAVLKKYGVECKGELFDTMLAHYMFQPEMRHNMDFLSETYLHYSPVPTEKLLGAKGKNQLTMRDVPVEHVAEYCNEDTDVTYQLKKAFAPMLKETHTVDVFEKIEMPLVPILCEMEMEGVTVDISFLNDYSNELQTQATALEKQVYEYAGETFNLSSPRQLGDILFDKLKLDPKAKKTKTGQYATGEEVLQKLAASHPIIDCILEYREITKLKSTYADALPLLVNKQTGRVHTSYMQAVAVTGRLSSQNPNLQNIPVRTDRGKEIRKAFIARDAHHVLLSADYSQIELRLVAEMSGDKHMIDAFKQGKDIHTATAAKVYNISESEVTKEMRHKAKSVNFGIIYGQGAFGLAENLKISRTEAKEIIDHYFEEFPSIKTYMDTQINFAREHGYVQTLLGRKRWLKDIHSANFTVRGFAERNAINMPLQGTAADMIKLAMISIDKAMKNKKMKSKMILQVHDELIFDTHHSEVDEMKKLIVDCMQDALPLKQVPIVAEVGVGKNWLEAH